MDVNKNRNAKRKKKVADAHIKKQNTTQNEKT